MSLFDILVHVVQQLGTATRPGGIPELTWLMGSVMMMPYIKTVRAEANMPFLSYIYNLFNK
ncbi:hypothetical protein [Mobiluncus mulieris]|uniref:Uncharacterized protein n=2 Tax=Mobiluncus mulieris TaxID=2052 RepID=A0A7Y0TZX3_9ACTO|nr:hypothetical protein [Mobiluncus mulieris]MCU9972206.1 hypothetical protein [Mobiluncus mulieris]MCU9973775.1 hypothetical protein [Mobiluncus mulieris]MCU9994212.1 hypothetical protein [Mobiluncus mulieris]MCU9997044.1 hypothetical protein [Mobiluncus mulieris]MCV0002763.1 hypothetical protein [Mobiluncus mulieris]